MSWDSRAQFHEQRTGFRGVVFSGDKFRGSALRRSDIYARTGGGARVLVTRSLERRQRGGTNFPPKLPATGTYLRRWPRVFIISLISISAISGDPFLEFALIATTLPLPPPPSPRSRVANWFVSSLDLHLRFFNPSLLCQ